MLQHYSPFVCVCCQKKFPNRWFLMDCIQLLRCTPRVYAYGTHDIKNYLPGRVEKFHGNYYYFDGLSLHSRIKIIYLFIFCILYNTKYIYICIITIFTIVLYVSFIFSRILPQLLLSVRYRQYCVVFSLVWNFILRRSLTFHRLSTMWKLIVKYFQHRSTKGLWHFLFVF